MSITAASVLVSKKRQPEKIKTAKVVRRNLIQTVSASGKIKSAKKVNLKFQTSGKLSWVGVREGNRVKKWQAIASLDKKELRKKLKQELIDYMNERWDFEQTHQDYKDSLVTDSIKRILEKAQFDLNRDVIDVEIADLTLKLATIYSPINGIVTHIDTPVAGINITPSTAKFTVADPDQVYFEADVDEVDIGQIKEGQETTLILDAYPEEEIKGNVSWIGFQAQTTRGGGTVFPIKIKLRQNKDYKFKLGMNGDIEIVTAKKENVLTIPRKYLRTKADQNQVYLLKNGKLEIRNVKTGLTTLSQVEILNGLNEGEKVALTKNSHDQK